MRRGILGDATTSAAARSSAQQVLLLYHDAGRRDVIVAGLEASMLAEQVQATGANAYDRVIALQPDLLIWDMETLDDDAQSALERIAASNPLPIIVFSKTANSDDAKRALHLGVSAFVVDGLETGRVSTLVDLAIERFRLIDSLHQELKRSKEELAARKSIERAKGLLMERRNLSEREAYEAMRRMAMAQGKTIRTIADTILSISDILP